MNRVPTTDDLATDQTRSRNTCEVEVQHADRQDHLVVAVLGVLSSSEAGSVQRALGTHLLDRGRVVVDLARASVEPDPAVQMFSAALAEAGGWPLARLVLARADAFTAGNLRTARVHLTVPVAGTLDEARALLDVRPPQVVRDHELPRSRMAPLLARLAIASACEGWGVDDDLHDAAATVASELVSNAVEHAGTRCTLQLTLDRRCLQVAVHDRRSVLEGCPQIVVPEERGYGLLIVQALSRSWGTTPGTDGKTVWALLDAARHR